MSNVNVVYSPYLNELRDNVLTLERLLKRSDISDRERSRLDELLKLKRQELVEQEAKAYGSD